MRALAPGEQQAHAVTTHRCGPMCSPLPMQAQGVNGCNLRCLQMLCRCAVLKGTRKDPGITPHVDHLCWRGCENAVLQQLPFLGESSTFGCELQFVHKDTCQVLADPIWNTLRNNHCFNVVAKQCFVDALHKGHLAGEAKAIRVPSGATDRMLPQAFSFHMEVQHVQVEAGIRIVGEAAWRSCQRLQVVHLPDTVVCLEHRAFRRCYQLRAAMGELPRIHSHHVDEQPPSGQSRLGSPNQMPTITSVMSASIANFFQSS